MAGIVAVTTRPHRFGPHPRSLEERLSTHVAVIEECWEWTGCRKENGYGVIKAEGARRNEYVHRAAYRLWVGPIPEGLSIDHLCRNRVCVRPEHLEAVPIGVNVLRGNGPPALQARQSRCRRGHPFDKVSSRGRRLCSLCRRLYDIHRRRKRAPRGAP